MNDFERLFELEIKRNRNAEEEKEYKKLKRESLERSMKRVMDTEAGYDVDSDWEDVGYTRTPYGIM